MNSRERFDATMHFQPRDRCPIMDFGFWDETLVLWRAEGYPAGSNPDRYFGMDPQWRYPEINCGLCPAFETVLLEDRPNEELIIDSTGVTKVQGKFLGSIPRHVDHLLKDRASWNKHYKWRLDGNSPERYSADWDSRLKAYTSRDRDYPLAINVGSLYGWIRDWMGMEQVSFLLFDDPSLFEEMVETIADCVIESIRPALESGIRFEYAGFWEDMCYRAGPLLPPAIFKKVLVPAYRRITSLLHRHGTDVVLVDCDGDISLLVPAWLDAGVNTMFPIEVGVWDADPVAYRSEYGRSLLMIGGVGKRVLASDRDQITREVERLAPLVEEGGYIPTPDHRVPPDIPLANYLHYLREARRIWGRGLPNLPPMDPRAVVLLERSEEAQCT